MRTAFFRVLASDDKAQALRDAINIADKASNPQRFDVGIESFARIPGSPFCYWVSDKLRSAFSEFPAIEHGSRTVRAGGQTSDDSRYLRCYWEIDVESSQYSWFTYLKGGKAQKFYSDQVLVAPWDLERSTFPGFTGRPGRASEKPSNYELYFQPGITWPLRASAFSPQVMPAGCIFTVRSYAIHDDEQTRLALLAVLSASTVDFLAKLLLGRFGFPEFVVGVIQKLPIPTISDEDAREFGRLALEAWALLRSLDTSVETSHAFTVPALLQMTGSDPWIRSAAWSQHVVEIKTELSRIQTDINARCFDLYGISSADRVAISQGISGGQEAPIDVGGAESSFGGLKELEDDDVRDEDPTGEVNESALAADLVSWAASVAIGRFDLRLATGAGSRSEAVASPFDAFPVCSRATLKAASGGVLGIPASEYPLQIPFDGILVDDPGHERDITAAVRTVFDRVFGSEADIWWSDISRILRPDGGEMRGWLADGFFEHHLKRHSRSRRKAPIIWQIGVPSNRYSVWLFCRRLNRDSILQIQNDIVTPKLVHEERHLANLRQDATPNVSSKERKDIDAQESFVEELRNLLDEIKRVAALWRFTLDDGAVLAMAPLWRLAPQHQPWQKELKSKWDELVSGKYDWSHIAMHLWPERVVPKCALDRSLAIAHGLEENFWLEGEDGKWKSLEAPKRPIDVLLRERMSNAAKAALKSLIEAPEATSGAKRARKPRAA